MKHNFDEIISRRGTNSVKWDTAENSDVLPMWVADMDFRTAPAMIDALAKRVQHGIFGYAKVPQAFYDATIGWFSRRHNFNIQKDWLLYTSGVVPAVSAVIKALTEPGDKVIIQTPVYNCFFSSIRNNDCEVSENRLLYESGAYSIDFEDLEKKAADPKATVFLLCSPHNPGGRVWRREELQRMGEICLRNNVKVISDEIHWDFVHPGYTHLPFASLNEKFLQNSVICTAPSKTFNIAGLQVAIIMAADEGIRNRIDKALNINEVCDINAFAVEALIAAYTHGEEWLEELKKYLYDNYLFLSEFFKKHLPHLSLLPFEASYLVWVDCSAIKQTSKEIVEALLTQENLWLNEGPLYGEAGEGFIRINIATPRENIKKGLEKIRNLYGK